MLSIKKISHGRIKRSIIGFAWNNYGNMLIICIIASESLIRLFNKMLKYKIKIKLKVPVQLKKRLCTIKYNQI
jgi:hypothetical protein